MAPLRSISAASGPIAAPDHNDVREKPIPAGRWSYPMRPSRSNSASARPMSAGRPRDRTTIPVARSVIALTTAIDTMAAGMPGSASGNACQSSSMP